MKAPRELGILLLAVLLVVVVSLWCGSRMWHGRYRHVEGLYTSELAETLVDANLERSSEARSLLSGFAQLGRYRDANRSLATVASGRVVFYGDSITDLWSAAYPKQFFPGKAYVGRGISGQSTPEMVWRFQQDVIELHPSAVVILAGSNDVVQPERHISYQETVKNIQIMAQMARQHRIRVILCSIPPVSHFPQPQQAAFTRRIRRLNLWLRTYAAEEHLTYVDYSAAMASSSGTMQDRFTTDGIHPNAAGYEVMRSLAQEAIDDDDTKSGEAPPSHGSSRPAPSVTGSGSLPKA